jgi:hypothetical protein
MTDLPIPAAVLDYLVDAGQRSVLFMDVMRQRTEQSEAHDRRSVPHVLSFGGDLVCDGRTLPRPVNYLLARVRPPEGTRIDPLKRPFVVIDPRAGHGPGIGGFKADSEIGVAFRAGHPCYFVGFLPDPVPGQTIEDIAHAEAHFLELVIAAHPGVEGKPAVIGNCQAGWAVMIVAALRPDLFGPIIIAGSPLSYWAGVKGQYPMRYSGGLLGGSWLTAMTGDLGHGVFDGAWLVTNFENQNPANTLWSKPYNLYAKIDTEVPRYLGFEKWWGGHVSLNAEEMQFIVDELFVGNRLAAGEIRTSDGTAVDLRNIRSPIVVFCSRGDNITPPQQALDWVLDLYDDVDDIRAYGQTIVYTVHDSIGHLGIFVSGSVARKEHDEFASNIDLIDVLPPGLYEAVLIPRAGDDGATGDWVMRCEARTLDDIRAMGGNSLDEERMFETAARVSEVNLALYRTVLQPSVRAMAAALPPQALRNLHPLRLQTDLFGKANPFMPVVARMAETARQNRKPVAPDNPFLLWQEKLSDMMVEGLETWRRTAERWSEDTFRAIYGNEALQSALGVDTETQNRPRKAARNLLHKELTAARVADLRASFGKGGLREAAIRALLWIGGPRGAVDERGFGVIRRLRDAEAGTDRPSLADFKALVRRQFLMLVIDERAAMDALPGLLPADRAGREAALDRIRSVLESTGPVEGEVADRLDRIAAIFLPDPPPARPAPAVTVEAAVRLPGPEPVAAPVRRTAGASRAAATGSSTD